MILVIVVSVPFSPVFIVIVVPVSSAVPVMIVFNSAAVSRPVTDKELPSVVARCYPIRSLIRRPRPVAPMPSVVFSCWIPIPFHPNELLTWRWRLNVNDPRRRWRSDGNTNRNLRVSCRSAHQKHCCNKCDFQETAHGICLLHLPFHHSASHRFKASAQAPRCLNANCPEEQVKQARQGARNSSSSLIDCFNGRPDIFRPLSSNSPSQLPAVSQPQKESSVYAARSSPELNVAWECLRGTPRCSRHWRLPPMPQAAGPKKN